VPLLRVNDVRVGVSAPLPPSYREDEKKNTRTRSVSTHRTFQNIFYVLNGEARATSGGDAHATRQPSCIAIVSRGDTDTRARLDKGERGEACSAPAAGAGERNQFEKKCFFESVLRVRG
jgi:hypothetical protein